jgi:diaminohydroxyphosphoribosylaminopyrimidine deaminase / 5-amino-6-(5-phosphoribosylamino)uracil reductase
MTDEGYMRLALRLAARGRGKTSPNPLVGAVLVRRGRIIGQGFHAGPGYPHAEIKALRAAKGEVSGGILYTNLEPCSHLQKRTPPCIHEIINRKIQKVVVAMRDPNPQVNGRGLRKLRQAGVAVREGILRQEALGLNEAYAKYMSRGRPFVILKLAQTLDGKIATAAGDSRWISSVKARRYSHRLRAEVDAVMVGIGTLQRDDPRLTARTVSKQQRQPVRVVLDSHLRIPAEARLLRQKPPEKTWIATTPHADRGRIQALERLGVKVLMVKECRGRVDLSDLMRLFGEMQVMSVLVEGGSELNASALQEGIVDKVFFFMAPRIMGGQDSKGSIGGRSPRHLGDTIPIEDVKVRRIGPDLLVEGYISRSRRGGGHKRTGRNR